MENVVFVDDLGDFIARTIAEVEKGCAAARKETGMVVDSPKEIQISVTLIDRDGWQVLETKGGETTETNEIQGGGTTETTTKQDRQEQGGTRNTSETQTGEDTNGAENVYNQTSVSTYTFSDVN